MSDKPFSLSIKAVILDDQGKCLLLKRSMKSKGNPGKWDLPGGKLDPGESFDQALTREVHEETGLTIELTRPLATTQSESPSKRIVYLIMEAQMTAGELTLSDEHEGFMWVDRGDLADVDVADQFRAFLKSYTRGAE